MKTKKSKTLLVMVGLMGITACMSSCNDAPKTKENQQFTYLIDEFADLKVMRYQIPGWNELSLNQKAYIYHLSEAAKFGRDITWDQHCKYNIPVRHTLENILNNYQGSRQGEEWNNFVIYAKRVFFSNGIHHHYALDKIMPACSQEYFASLMDATGQSESKAELLPVIFDKDLYAMSQYVGSDKDILMGSAVNFYDGSITKNEANDFYNQQIVANDSTPISYGLNSKLVRDEKGQIVEQVYKIDGLYGEAIGKIVNELEEASKYAENDTQRKYIAKLVEYYKTGDLKTWDEYNILWVQDSISDIDFVNGFIEDYGDPLGRKATWEGLVNFKNAEASKRADIISMNAQWFEDHSPVAPEFKKKEVKGVTAKVITATCLAGDCYPSTPIGINLPNADWIRKDYGSKSVTIENITAAYDLAAEESPKNMLSEFAWDQAEIDLVKKYGNLTGNVHTDLHECLGHGSGQLLPGTASTALGEFSSTLEETRADLFGLYYIADPKLVELGILPDNEAYKAEYASFIRNGLFTQFVRVELGKTNTEAHMQNRKLISEWCYEQGLADNVIEKKVRDGKTYFVVNDYQALRGLFGKLLAEIQRIKSEGDYQTGKALVEKYAVNIDPKLHKEVKERYAMLNLKPYGGFVNPDIEPVIENGKITDYKVIYVDNYLQQMLDYGKKYATLK